MQHISLDRLQTNIETVFTRVSDDREALAVALDENRSVVIVDLDDYNSLMETLHLLRHPANVERLREGIRQHRAGQRTTSPPAPSP